MKQNTLSKMLAVGAVSALAISSAFAQTTTTKETTTSTGATGAGVSATTTTARHEAEVERGTRDQDVQPDVVHVVLHEAHDRTVAVEEPDQRHEQVNDAEDLEVLALLPLD